jgi:Ca-activated chloride channel family protein
VQKIIGLIAFILMGFLSHSQITASKTSFDFGELYNGAQTYTDITFKNTSGKMQFLLTIDKPQDVYYIFSSKRVMPDSSITIRFKINENRKGRFNYQVGVYFSDPRDPIMISLKGEVKETGTNSMTACPDFNSAPPAYQQNQFDAAVKVIDSLTREPLKNATVYFVQNGELVGESTTNSKGFVKKRLTLGYYYITAQRPPYNSNYREGYMNYKRNYVEIPLSKDPVEEVLPPPPPVEEEVVINENPPPPPPVEEEVIEIVIEEEPPVVVEDPVDPPAVDPPLDTNSVVESRPPVEPTTLEELPDTVFTNDYFKYNNITFILDVSTSMSGMGKMDLMKMSMIELTKILRHPDMVSMIKYSSEVETILKGSHGDQKEEIISVVKGLKYSGMTAGGDAIKAAYKLNKKTYIENGNNMVIMITDGVFNKGDKDYLKTIEKNYENMGIKFSVVGIKTSDFITKHMLNVVSYGAGDFIRILSIDDAQAKLIEEIKRSSFKY